MGAGGIINQRAKVIIKAVQDPSLYDSLPSVEKDLVDAIAAKEPLSFNHNDLEQLVKLLKVAIRS